MIQGNRRLAKQPVPLIDPTRCDGCGLCVRVCPTKVRLAFLIGGALLFGFIFGFLVPGGLNPNPVASLRTLLTTVLVKHQLVLPIAAMLLILLLIIWVSNKSICGWGCQLGLLQDLLHGVPLPKQCPESIEGWKPPFWLPNSVRIVAFVALVAGLVAAGLDWIGLVDPFQLFSFKTPLKKLRIGGFNRDSAPLLP